MSPHCTTIARLFAACLSLPLLISIHAQPITLTYDHPIVIDNLIHYYDSLATHIATSNAVDPDNSDSRQLGVLRIFGVSAAGYQTLGAILGAAKSRIDNVRSLQTQYVNGLAKNPPSSASVSATLNDLYQQQIAIFQSVPFDLKKNLSADDWSAVQSFIAAKLIANIKVAKGAPPVP